MGEPGGPLTGRRIVLGVSGGIAAYKAAELCRLLMHAGGDVQPVMTADATRFVTALTLSALSGHPTGESLWDGPEPIPHTRFGQWADVVIVAPATARVIGAYAAGISDDLLTATLLATRAPVIVCPAMHAEMWEHPAVVDNIATLRRRGVTVVGPAAGRLAGGDVGPGRLAELSEIVAAAAGVGRPRDLGGYRVLVTAGGTREPIDPVRFLGNRSSGKQGHALATAAAARGATVILVSTAPPPPTGRRHHRHHRGDGRGDGDRGRRPGARVRRGHHGGRSRRLPAQGRRRAQAEKERRFSRPAPRTHP